ncbi:LLM class flavin-dependent oxidoreductase [Paenibacillus doosanensis]|uniref:Alkanal monooxygenase alpha chain n=1 Tax=Paenibacillus konkukensis TaxID=2020716 RepID=A0ABY4RT01_9BACL|nr:MULTISPECIES: LLM class flavin-dependent oxidoreductase [Paenibacillus]MCS7459681.1 LLM class flavin-dependent oxidoreductase [Paenibacillus doosanensis]UQZ84658.1 Alkanal monooxygenase alpha chain [Paenibacillus konkukensis]
MADSANHMEIGISTFLETTPDPVTGEVISQAERLRHAVEEIVLADQVGLDVYGIGEHHRPDYAGSSPAVVLAAAAAMTKNIRLTSAVTVLSSDDPVRVYQSFSTLDGISNGRAEIMAGRGSFIESFPLFGYSLDDYDELFEEKLELLLAIRASEKVTWRGGHRPAIRNLGVYPRSVQDPLPVWIASGGNPQSAVRAGMLGLPIAFAIIGGVPQSFAPLVALYKEAAARAGHDPAKLQIATHSHGFVGDTSEQAADLFFPPTQAQMNVIGRERGWGQPYSRSTFDAARSLRGALYVGDPEYVAEKIVLLRKNLGVTRFFLHVNVGTMPHKDVLRSIELLGTRVAPIVRKELARSSE